MSQEFIGHLYTYVHVKSQFSTLRKHEYLMIKSKDFPTTKCNIVSRRQLRKSKLQFLAVSVKWKKNTIVKSIGNPNYNDNLTSLINGAADWHEPLLELSGIQTFMTLQSKDIS